VQEFCRRLLRAVEEPHGLGGCSCVTDEEVDGVAALLSGSSHHAHDPALGGRSSPGAARGCESPAKWWELKLIPGDDQSAETSSGTDPSSSSRSPPSFAIEPSEK
jgi:hypothetical protein